MKPCTKSTPQRSITGTLTLARLATIRAERTSATNEAPSRTSARAAETSGVGSLAPTAGESSKNSSAPTHRAQTTLLPGESRVPSCATTRNGSLTRFQQMQYDMNLLSK